jgi:AcrR family transcriptional regulator
MRTQLVRYCFSIMAAPATHLPRGRHAFTREAVAAAQRARLLAAVAEAVADKGYAATTVGHVVKAAGVSRRTFYEQFTDLEACFLAAYQEGMEWLLDEIRAAVPRDAPWRERAAVSLEAYLHALAARPDAAWAFTIENLGAGPRVLEHRAQVLGRWVRQWQALRPGLAADAALLLVGGIEEIVRERLRTQKPLPALADRLTEIALEVLER